VLKAFVFDAYGTLFDVFSVTALCESLFPGSGHALARLWRAKQLQYSLLRSMMNCYEDFWQLTADGLVYASKSLALDLTLEKRDRLMQAYLALDVFPDVEPGLEALRALDVRCAILSNGSPSMLATVLARSRLLHLFEAVISVDDIKIFKPSPRVYGLVGSHLRLSAPEIGFVSSNNWDVHGAGAAGLTACWIQRSASEPSEELGFPPAHIVRSMTELAALVGK
jgi:2-haloacid dehalogenase